MTKRRTYRSSTRSLARQAAACLFWLAVWQVASALVNQPLIFAGPVATLEALGEHVVTGRFWLAVAASLGGISAGFFAAFIAAFLLALASDRWKWVSELLAPFMAFVKATPVACVVVLFLIWLGSDLTVVTSVFLVVLPAYYYNLLKALSQLDRRQDALLASFGITGCKRFFAFVWPELVPYVSAASATIVGMSWKAGVAAELIGMAANTLGERVYQAKILLETADLFAWTATVIACAWLCERLVLLLVSASGPASVRVALRMHGAHSDTTPASLRASDVSLYTPKGERIVSGVSFDLEPGHALCVMGPSGVGKTTLVESILGNRTFEGGLDVPRRLSVCFQEARLFENLSLADNVRIVAPRAAEKDIGSLLSELLPDVDPSRLVSTLSGGQRRRVELARALLAPSAAVVLDEPFAGLDRQTHERVAGIVLSRLHGRPLVVTTHDDSDAELLHAEIVRLS